MKADGEHPAASGGIIRTRKNRDYFTAANQPFNDRRLSWRARGLMGYLLSKPDDWEVRVPDLIRQGDVGRDAMTNMLRELERFGYLVRTKTQDEHGRWQWLSEVYEIPVAPESNPDLTDAYATTINGFSGHGQAPSPGLPFTAEPFTAEPFTAEPFTVKPLINKRLRQPSTELTKDPGNEPPNHQATQGSGGGLAHPDTVERLAGIGLNKPERFGHLPWSVVEPIVAHTQADHAAKVIRSLHGALNYRLTQVHYTPPPVPPEPAPPNANDTIWSNVVAWLAPQVADDDLRTWVEPARLVELNYNYAIVAASTVFGRDALARDGLGGLIAAGLEQVTGVPRNVEFVIDG